jgi:hypothetical protein
MSSLRAGYRFKLPGSRSLQAHVDDSNVTNRANFNNPTTVIALGFDAAPL